MNWRMLRIVLLSVFVFTLIGIPYSQGADRGKKINPRICSATGESVAELSFGKKLVRRLWNDIKARNMEAIEKWITPGFQSIHQDGARDREAEIKLISGLDLGEYTLSNFKVTQVGPVIIATYFVSVEETIAGKRLSKKPAARLSAFLKTESSWKWIAHANLKALK